MKPDLKDKFDTNNFSKEIIKEKPELLELKEMDKNIVDDHKDKFEDF